MNNPNIYGDPLAAYKDPEGNYIDSDEDNIPDIVESLLSNNSTFAKFARLFADPTSEYYDLWTSYNWTIAYFFSVRNDRDFHYYLEYLNAEEYSVEEIARYITGWNNTAPHNKSCAENATQWLRDEFNPLITESMAPVITEFHVNTVYEGYVAPLVPNAKAHVVAEIRDVAGISRVRIKSVCPDVFGIMTWTIVKEYDGSQTSIYLDEIIDVTEVSAVLTYNISVNATDTLGNSAEWYKEVDGPFGVVIKTIAKALAMFWEFLCEVGAKILEGLNILVKWIIGFIEGKINATIGEMVDYIISSIKSAEKYLEEGDIKGALYSLLPLIIAIGTGMFVLIMVIGTLITIFPVVGLIVMAAIASIFTLVLMNMFESCDEYRKIGESIGSDIDSIRNFLEGINTDLGNFWWVVSTFVNFGNIIFLCLVDVSPSAIAIAIFGSFFVGLIASAIVAAWSGPPTPSLLPAVLISLGLDLFGIISLTIGIKSILSSNAIQSSPGRLVAAIVWIMILYTVALGSVLINLGYISKCI